MLIESNTNNKFFFIEDPELQFVQFWVKVLYQVDILNVKNNLYLWSSVLNTTLRENWIFVISLCNKN